MKIAQNNPVGAINRRNRAKTIGRCAVYRLIVLAAIFLGIYFITETFMPILLATYAEYSLYFYLLEIGVAGFFIIRILSQLMHLLVRDISASQARAARGMIVIAGYLLVIAIAISFLAQDPTVTVVIGTVTGIILGISLQSLIGNAVAGLVLSLTRPFRLGDRITVFGNTGVVYDIGLLYTTLVTSEDTTVLAPNASLLTSPVLRDKREHRPRTGAVA